MTKGRDPSKRHSAVADVLHTPELPVHTFGAGDVAEILGMEPWRLQKFLVAKLYQLVPEGGQLGKGPGSRRLFRVEDLYRLAIADRLVRDGFAPQSVSRTLQEIENNDLLRFGPGGREDVPAIGFIRGPDGPRVEAVHGTATRGTGADEPYYVLDVAALIRQVDQRIYARTNRGASR